MRTALVVFSAVMVLCVALVLAYRVGAASAQVDFPATISGTVMIDGELAPDGTSVFAGVGGIKVGSAVTTNGMFSMLITPVLAKSHPGAVSFLVGGIVTKPSMEIILAPGVEATGIILRAYSSPILAPELTISPTSGVPLRTVLTVSGRYYTPDESHPVLFGEIGTVEQAGANVFGNFEVYTTVPRAPQGDYTVRVGQAEAVFTVIPGVTLSQDAASPGAIVQIYGDGFPADHKSIKLRFGVQTLLPVTSDSDGSVRWTFEVPSVPVGAYYVRVGSADPVVFNVVDGVPASGAHERCYTGIVTREEVIAVIGMYFAGQSGPLPTPTPTPTPTPPTTAAYEIAEGSEITFTVGHVLSSSPALIDAVLRSTEISGHVNIGGETSIIQVDLHTLSSDQQFRDQYVRDNMFPNDPIAEFTVDNIGRLPTEFYDGDTFRRQVRGTLRLKGKEFPLTFDLEVRRDENILNVLGRTTVTWEQLEIPVPAARSLVSIEDDIHVEVLLVATKGTPAPTPAPSQWGSSRCICDLW